MCTDIAALPFDDERRRCKNRLQWDRLSMGIFTMGLREQRTMPQRRIVVARVAYNDNWLVISHCVIQWNTIERGREIARRLRLVAAFLRRVLIDPAANFSA